MWRGSAILGECVCLHIHRHCFDFFAFKILYVFIIGSRYALKLGLMFLKNKRISEDFQAILLPLNLILDVDNSV